MANVGSTIGRTASGAATGATIGSAIPGVGTAIGGAVGGAVGLISGLFSDDSSPEAEALKKAAAELDALDIPDEQKRTYTRQLLQRAGELRPELEYEIKQADTELAKIQEDPMLRQKQREVIANLMTKTEQGLDAEDMAARNELVREVGREASGRNEAVLTGMARRGMLGSGAQLGAQLANEQAAAERSAIGAEKLAATRANAMRDALEKLGGFTTTVRGQEYGISKDKATAQDIINSANTSASRDVLARNIAAKNRAAAANLAETQRIADSNVMLRNQDEADKAAARAAIYNDKRRKIIDRAGLEAGGAKAEREQQARGDEQFAGIAKGIGEFGANPAIQNSLSNAFLSEDQVAGRNAEESYAAEQKLKNKRRV